MGAGSRASTTLKNVPRVRVMGTAASLSVGVQHAVPPQPPFDLSAAMQMMTRVIDGSLSTADLSRPALAAAKTAACSAAAAACGALFADLSSRGVVSAASAATPRQSQATRDITTQRKRNLSLSLRDTPPSQSDTGHAINRMAQVRLHRLHSTTRSARGRCAGGSDERRRLTRVCVQLRLPAGSSPRLPSEAANAGPSWSSSQRLPTRTTHGPMSVGWAAASSAARSSCLT